VPLVVLQQEDNRNFLFKPTLNQFDTYSSISQEGGSTKNQIKNISIPHVSLTLVDNPIGKGTPIV
jgi:hypothetical protein